MARPLVILLLLIPLAGGPTPDRTDFSRTAAERPPVFGWAALAAQSAVQAGPNDILTLNCTLRARNTDQVKEELIALAEANDGYLLKMSARRVEVYLSRKLTPRGVIARLGKYGQLQSRSLGKKDVDEKLRDLGTAIRVREEHLAKLEKMVEGSNVSQALDLEREVNRVMTEIEENRGELGYLRERVALMRLSVSFLNAPAASGPGGVPIPWLRDLNIEDFLERF